MPKLKLPFAQIFVGDFLSSTMFLTAEQTGGYIRIWLSMWNAGGSLPNDPAKLARICGVSLSRWERIAPDILSFFTVEGDRLTQEKLNLEYRRAEGIVEKRSAAGKKGNQAKSLKLRKRGPANGRAKPKYGERILESDLELDLESKSNSHQTRSAAADVPVKAAVTIFDDGRKYLEANGISEKNARSNLGKWRRDYGDEPLLAALHEARRQEAIDPVAFINATLKQRTKSNSGFGARSAQAGIEGA